MQETLSSSNATEELVAGNLAARMAAVACVHQLALLSGRIPRALDDNDRTHEGQHWIEAGA